MHFIIIIVSKEPARTAPQAGNEVDYSTGRATFQPEAAEQRLGDAVGEFLLFKVAPEGWGTGWQAGPTFGVELKEGELRLRDDQFAYVDPVAGTMSGEDINDPESRVYAELVKRGWTPPGEIAYPPHKKAQPGDGSGDTCYRNGWNECRIATMHLNQKNGNGVGR